MAWLSLTSSESILRLLRELVGLLSDMVYPLLLIISLLGARKLRENVVRKLVEKHVEEVAALKSQNVAIIQANEALRDMVARKSGIRKGDSPTSSSPPVKQDS